MADYIYIMESRLTPEQQRGVTLVQEVARAHGMNIYLVGGVVRDIISGASIRDLDFAVQGNALKLVKDLEKAGAIIEGTDEHLRTVYVLLPGNLRGEVTSARSEVYDKPGKPPEMSPATINEDVRRRDFTMNAMALSLNPGSRGLLLDPFNGVADIESKLIRILHNYAFLEEPSRLIRATRFCARFDWQFEERTQARYDAAKENKYIEQVNRKLLGHEIEQVAHENDPLKVMRALEKEGWLAELHPHWSVSKVDVPGLNHLMKIRQQLLDLSYTLDAGPAVMYFITNKMNTNDVHALQTAIHRKAFVTAWKHLEDDARDFAKKLTGKDAALPSQAWKMLQSTKPETILFTAATTKNSAAARKIQDFLGKWRQVRTRLPLPEMAELRITPELPEYPKLADEVFLMLLDGKLKSHTETINFLKPYSPPEPVAPPPPVRRGRGAKKAAKVTPSVDGGAAPVKGKRGRKPGSGAATANGNQKEGAMDDQGNPTTPLEKAAVAVGKAVGSVVKAVTPEKKANASEKPAVAAKKRSKPAAKKTAAKKPIKKNAAKKPAPKKKAAVKKPAKKRK
ncbi:MAG: Polynucleotide adenylyltransferase [Candidatus Angelobacter sp.]|jgi:tRNA nucleotidyltransferase (CCA-adding enzyme)|nr:Polynucleotide adenylyltransferase [Candidatus Angelobacter sp.]